MSVVQDCYTISRLEPSEAQKVFQCKHLDEGPACAPDVRRGTAGLVSYLQSECQDSHEVHSGGVTAQSDRVTRLD